MKKLLILENYNQLEIPKRLRAVIDSDWAKGYDMDLWLHFHEAWWPKNRAESLKRLFTGDIIVCDHVFDGFQQLEIFIEVLQKFKAKGKVIDLYIMNNSLEENFRDWLKQTKADTLPNTDWYNNSRKRTLAHKQALNVKFLDCLKYHNVYKLRYAHELSDGKLVPIKEIS